MSELLLQNGITTIAEPGFPSSDFDGELQLLMKEMAKNPPYDVYLIPSGTQLYGMKGGNKEAMTFMKTLDAKPEYNTTNVKFLPNQVKLFSGRCYLFPTNADERRVYRRTFWRMDDTFRLI